VSDRQTRFELFFEYVFENLRAEVISKRNFAATVERLVLEPSGGLRLSEERLG
jgi:hypothetical protein